MTELKRTLGLWDVVLLNVVAIIGLRWLPLAAKTGASSIVLWLLAFLVFFLPLGLTVVELTTRYPEAGGIYVWTKRAFGNFHGFVCGWCYWVNNLFYFPTLLISAAGMSVYIFGVELLQQRGWQLEESKTYVTIFTLIFMWAAVAINVLGMSIGRWVQNFGGISTWIPGAMIIILGLLTLVFYGSATSFTSDSVIPTIFKSGVSSEARFDNLNFWANMCFAFAGLELASTMSGEIHDARRAIPRAIFISGIVITLVYILGTISLLVALPADQLNLISGAPQAATNLGEKFNLSWLGNLAALLIVFGNIAGVVAWFGGAARVLFAAGLDSILPPVFSKLHPRYGSPYITMLLQGGLSTAILLMGSLGKGSSVETFYLSLANMTLIVYFVPFLYMFLSLISVRFKEGEAGEGVISVPGGKAGAVICGLVGFTATAIAMWLATLPPSDTAGKESSFLGLAISAASLFRLQVIGGCLFFILLGAIFYFFSTKKGQSAKEA